MARNRSRQAQRRALRARVAVEALRDKLKVLGSRLNDLESRAVVAPRQRTPEQHAAHIRDLKAILPIVFLGLVVLSLLQYFAPLGRLNPDFGVILFVGWPTWVITACGTYFPSPPCFEF